MRLAMATLTRMWRPLAVLAVFTFGLAGAVAGDSRSVFQSTVLLSIQPQQFTASPSAVVADSDRYVNGQIAVLKSTAMAERVAAAVGDLTASEVIESLGVRHESGSDLVEVTITRSTAKEAQKIAAALADQALAGINERVLASLQAVRDAKLLEADLAAASAEVDAAAAAHAEASAVKKALQVRQKNELLSVNLEYQVQLADEQLRLELPRLEAARAAYSVVAQRQNDIENASKRQVTSAIIEPATLPTEPITTRDTALAVAIVLIGGALSALYVGVSLSFGPRVSLRRHLERSAKARMVGAFSKSSGTAAALGDLKSGDLDLLDHLAVRTELHDGGSSTRVAVVAMDAVSACHPTATLLAQRFEQLGASVALVERTQGQLVRQDGSGGSERLLDLLEAPDGVCIIDCGDVNASALPELSVRQADAIVLSVPFSGCSRDDLQRVVSLAEATNAELLLVRV